MSMRLRNLFFPAAAGILSAFIVMCLLGFMHVKGTSMEPAIMDGSIVIVNKMAYLCREPEAGDVVAFRCDVYGEGEEGNTLLRRVAASEGDTVKISDGNLYVNDEIYGDYWENRIYLDPMNEITVARDHVFVLCDSQAAAMDSRDKAVGQLSTDELYGKVCFR